MPTVEQLVKAVPMDNGGQFGGRGLSFQRDWAICHLLELHLNDKNYIVIFEHHDDVTVTSTDDSEDLITFYQIKSKKSGNWSVGELLKTANKAENTPTSILGKMFIKHFMFPGCSVSVKFVSNMPLSLKGISDIENDSEVCLENVDDKTKAKIIDKLRQEFGTCIDGSTCPSLYISRGFFVRTSMSHNGSKEYAIGKINNFFASIKPTLTTGDIVAFYRTMYDAINVRSNHEYNVTESNTLVAQKSLTRKDMQNLIDNIHPTNHDEIQKEMIRSLEASGMEASEAFKIKVGYQNYVAMLANDTDSTLKRTVMTVKQKTKEILFNTVDSISLQELFVRALNAIRAKRLKPKEIDDNMLKALIWIAYHE